MSDDEAGIRELKTHLSGYLREVKSGGTVVVTEHGKPIARISPYSESLEAELDRMRDAGLAEWNGGGLTARKPVAANRGDLQASEAVVDERVSAGNSDGDAP